MPPASSILPPPRVKRRLPVWLAVQGSPSSLLLNWHAFLRYQNKKKLQTSVDGCPPNGLRFSCAASIDRNHCRAEISFQKRPDLGAAKRRQLQARVGRHTHDSFTI